MVRIASKHRVTSLFQAQEQTVCQQPKEYLFKILVIGDIGVGKTSFIKRYVHNFFSQSYKATVCFVIVLKHRNSNQIGVDFALKVLSWDANTIIRMQLWDIAGTF